VARRTLRRMFLSAFESERLDYAEGGCQIVHADLTWSLSLIVDGNGTSAPYRLVLGASLAQLGDLAPRKAEDCYLFWPLPFVRSDAVGPDAPRMPDAAFPDWSGSDHDRVTAIAQCVADVVRYARQVDSLDEMRARHSAGDYEGAFIIAPMRRLLEEVS
jgi:hypothetical protein